MLNVLARRQLLFSNAGGRRSFRQLERLVMPNNLQGAQMGLVIHKTTKTNQMPVTCCTGGENEYLKFNIFCTFYSFAFCGTAF